MEHYSIRGLNSELHQIVQCGPHLANASPGSFPLVHPHGGHEALLNAERGRVHDPRLRPRPRARPRPRPRPRSSLPLPGGIRRLLCLYWRHFYSNVRLGLLARRRNHGIWILPRVVERTRGIFVVVERLHVIIAIVIHYVVFYCFVKEIYSISFIQIGIY